MKAVQRILPYTKQLVLYALYDVLDSEESEYDKTENGCIAAEVTVYGNTSGICPVRIPQTAAHSADGGNDPPRPLAFAPGSAAGGGLSGGPCGTDAGKRAERTGWNERESRKPNMITEKQSRIFKPMALVLCLCLMIGLMPMTAFAAETGPFIFGYKSGAPIISVSTTNQSDYTKSCRL